MRPHQQQRPRPALHEVCVAIVALVCLTPCGAGAMTFYVRAHGNDLANGMSPSTAFASIGRAAARINNPGDQVIVGPGTFVEGNISPARSGFEGYPVVFLADVMGTLTTDPSGPVVVTPPPTQTTGFILLGRHHVVIDGFTIVGAIDAGVQIRPADTPLGVVSSSNVTVRNTLVMHSAKRGIDITAVGDVVVEANTATGSGSGGIVISSGGADGLMVVVSDNEVMQSGDVGLLIDGAAGGSIDHNSVETSGASGIRTQSSSNLSVTDNSVTGNADGIEVGNLQNGTLGENFIVSDNVLNGNTKSGITLIGSGDVTVNNNAVSRSGATGISVTAPDGTVLATLDISNNQLRQNGASGLFVAGASGGSIADNHIQESSQDGITVRTGAQLAVLRNIVTRSKGNGIAIGVTDAPAGKSFTVEDNDVTSSGATGVTINANGGVLSASRNTVLHSVASGLSVQSLAAPDTTSVANNTVGTSGSHGIFTAGISSGIVQNNVTFSNGDTGITVRGATDVLLVNNLVYANTTDGLAVGTADRGAPRAQVINNTVYANGGWGLTIGSANGPSQSSVVLDNIFQFNASGGFAVAGKSRDCLVSGFNVNPDGYSLDTPASLYDTTAAPRFVGPSGADRQLGGDNFADDDFHLQQGRGGQRVNSPGVDAGFAAAATLGLTGSTATGGVADIGVIDAGYHSGATSDQHLAVPSPYMPVFVRTNGKDTNDGLDPARALASIQEGARRARAGGTVVVGPGRYLEGNIHPVQDTGRVSFFADPTGMATADFPAPVLVDATGYDTGFTLLQSCGAVVDGFHVTGSMTAGIQVRAGADNSRVRDNVVFSNQRRGIEIFQADAGEIRNNLVYANGTGGIRVAQSQNSSVLNNTIYGNGADPVLGIGADAILVGGSGDSDAAPGTSVQRNIVAANSTGIKVQPNSFARYVTGTNIVADGFEGNSPRGDSDFIATPLFVNPSGPDRTLGGDGFADDDFHLRQDAQATSPGVDIDFSERDALADGSTRSDGLPDLGPLDAGYHYPFVPRSAAGQSLRKVVYVRTEGTDTNTGASPDHALASIAKALSVLSGDGLVVVAPGRYQESTLRLGDIGFPALLGDRTGVLTGAPAGKVVISSNAVQAVVAAGSALIDGVMLTGSRGPGLRVLRAAHDVTIRNATICGNTGDGVTTSGDGVRVLNSVACSNRGVGINVRLRRPRGATQVLSNTIDGNRREGIVVREIGSPIPYALVADNMVSRNGPLYWRHEHQPRTGGQP